MNSLYYRREVILVISPDKELVSVRIPKALNKRLAEYVAQIGMSKTALILKLIHDELSKQEAQRKQGNE